MIHLERKRASSLMIFTSGLVLGSLALAGSLQDPEPDDDPPASVVPATEQETPSLDELLGIEESEEAESESEPDVDALTENDRKKIDDRLNERELADSFSAAINDMAVAAQMLDESRSTGIDVQRLQKEIMSRLDAVIKEAAQQQQQQQQQSSSSQQQQQQQQSEQNQIPQQPENSNQSESQQAPSQQGESNEQLPPGRQEAQFQVLFEESDVEWGNLPDRMRNLLRQGMRESVSRMYRNLTESYYRRIAEDASE
ncbi:MAG: hypothetical protein CBC35_10175 [Planctomycetes bacterium TMED75]|nr:hypothetical protein [Planctomycetaceae bacterium]OUU91123.1 MAG: hypothetical protein CBC35_10175 [Planctomycetes bacterium TMED75]